MIGMKMVPASTGGLGGMPRPGPALGEEQAPAYHLGRWNCLTRLSTPLTGPPQVRGRVSLSARVGPGPLANLTCLVSTIGARASENDRYSGSAKLEAPPRCHGWPAKWTGPDRCEVREAKALVENAPRARGVSPAVRKCISSQETALKAASYLRGRATPTARRVARSHVRPSASGWVY